MALASGYRYLTPAFRGGPTGISPASLSLPRFTGYAGPTPPASTGYTPGPAPTFLGTGTSFTSPNSFLGGNPFAGTGSDGGGGSSGAASGGGSTSGSGDITFDYTHDPILLRIQALAKQQIADAKTAALEAERVNLIRYGDPAIAKSTLGKNAGDTAKAAKNNPFSTVAELARWNDRSQVGLDESYNNQNLFYSTARQRGKALQSEDYQRQQSKTASELQDAINAISQQLLAAKRQTQAMELQAEEEAYNRALSEAAAQRYYNSLSMAATASPTVVTGGS